MTTPSEYELEAWNNIQHFRLRPISEAMMSGANAVASGASTVAKKTADFVNDRPKVKAAIGKGSAVAGAGAKRVAEVVPDGAISWVKETASATTTTLAKVSRSGLTQDSVVKKHQKKGHDVAALRDVRKLDLEEVDRVRGRALGYYYPTIGALSGAGTGLAVTGTGIFTVGTAGAAAAPGFGVVAGALAADMAMVLGLSSRVIGHIALCYGYDPEDPSEKLFILSVVNFASAGTLAAKQAAWTDISRLSQALYRGKTWEILNQNVLTKVTKKVATQQGHKLTKKSLGKVVPVVSIFAGGVLNWAAIERIVDSAEVAYRRRFLLDKYPQLAESEAAPQFSADLDPDEQEPLSVVDYVEELRQSGELDHDEESGSPEASSESANDA